MKEGSPFADEDVIRLGPERGLSFLEHLSHNLTIAIRLAHSRLKPEGDLTEGQVLEAIFWINEAQHNVVQLTRNLRVEWEAWIAEEVIEWLEVWTRHDTSREFVVWAITRAFAQLNREP